MLKSLKKNHLDALSDDEASTSVTDLDASGAETAPEQRKRQAVGLASSVSCKLP